MKSNIFVEYYGRHKSGKEMEESAKAIWTNQGNKVKDISTLEFYAKPEENRVYFVINGSFESSFEF